MDNLQVYQTNDVDYDGFLWKSFYFVNELEFQDQAIFSQNISTEYENDNWYGYSAFAAYTLSGGSLTVNLTLSGHECSLQYE